jgi:hypothetical protein
VIGFTLIVLASQVQAADRRFMPVPQGASQTIQVINGMPILSSVGKKFQAATSVSVLSSKQGRLLVSIKNQTSAAMPMEAQAIVATSAGQVLSMRDASDAPSAREAPMRDCNGKSAEAYTDCMTDNFNRKAQAKSAAGKAKADAPVPKLIQPGEVFATQYYLELPRKQRGQLGAVSVTVEMAGERLSFDFKEVE